MPKFLVDKLKAEYPGNPSAVYGTLNNIGAMHGNKETAKGKAMQARHDRDSAKPVRAFKFNPAKNLGAYHHKPRNK